jgi:chromosome partitioning protein
MISETCSVCGTSFDVVFRYQMEEKDGGFAFYCSQKCLEKSQKGDGESVTCDACSKRFSPDLVSQILYLGGKRKYACSLDCRTQLVRESQGARLGDLAEAAKKQAPRVEMPAHEPTLTPVSGIPRTALMPGARPVPSISGTPAPPRVAVSPASAGTPAPRGAVVPSPAGAPAPVVAPVAAAPAAPTAPAPATSRAPGAAAAPRGTLSAPPAGPPSAPSAPVSQAPRSVGKAQARAKREEAPPAATSTRASGLMSAIRPENQDPAAGNDAPGTVIPVAPPLKGEKKPAPVKSEAPRRIAIFNHKGGTGKTTTAVSIAAGLAAKGKKVLLVDTDAQGNVSVSLGAGSERSLYHVLVMGLRVQDAVKEVRPNLFLLPSNETLAAAELYLAGRQNRDRVLADRLSAAAQEYDYVVLDCSPSLSLMNQNALVFADSVLVPVACDYLSLVGVRQVLKTVKNVNSLLHHPVQIWGVLPTFFDGRAKICNEAVATLKDHFGDKCLPPIRAAIKVKEAPSVGQTIFEYATGSNAAEDYGVIVDRILGIATAAPAHETMHASQPAPATARATA